MDGDFSCLCERQDHGPPRRSFKSSVEVGILMDPLGVAFLFEHLDRSQIFAVRSASSGCSATLGKTNSGSTVKMGWCNSITKKGNIAHEHLGTNGLYKFWVPKMMVFPLVSLETLTKGLLHLRTPGYMFVMNVWVA